MQTDDNVKFEPEQSKTVLHFLLLSKSILFAEIKNLIAYDLYVFLVSKHNPSLF